MMPKFRAYHNGEMLYNASKVGNALYWDNGDCFDLLAFKQETPPIMMQLVGVDIYEDDYVRYMSGNEGYYFEGVVEWVHHFGFNGVSVKVNMDKPYNYWARSMMTIDEKEYVHDLPDMFEIIGNVHANPPSSEPITNELIELRESICACKHLIAKYDGDFALSHLLEFMEERECVLLEEMEFIEATTK